MRLERLLLEQRCERIVLGLLLLEGRDGSDHVLVHLEEFEHLVLDLEVVDLLQQVLVLLRVGLLGPQSPLLAPVLSKLSRNLSDFRVEARDLPMKIIVFLLEDNRSADLLEEMGELLGALDH